MARVPQVLVSETFAVRQPLKRMPNALKAIAAVEKSLGKRGRAVVRWSGTEAKLRVMVEGDNEDVCTRHAERIVVAAGRDLA
jgi:phosphoglucosamine mutase